jgi:hypothetical protein
VSAPAGFTGPGDVVSGATAYWGFPIYNNTFAASLGTVFDWSCHSGSNTGSIHATSTGAPNSSDLTAMTTQCAGEPFILMPNAYDQTGNGNTAVSGGSARITDSLIGSFPGFACLGGGEISATITSVSQPVTYLAVANRTADFTTSESVITTYNGLTGTILSYRNATNTVGTWGGAAYLTVTASDSAYHALMGVANGASTQAFADGTGGGAGSGGTDATSVKLAVCGLLGGIGTLSGFVVGGGMWPADLTSSAAALSSNLHTNLGF